MFNYYIVKLFGIKILESHKMKEWLFAPKNQKRVEKNKNRRKWISAISYPSEVFRFEFKYANIAVALYHNSFRLEKHS